MELAPGKRQGLSRISGLLGAQSVSCLEAVQSSSGAPMALWSIHGCDLGGVSTGEVLGT